MLNIAAVVKYISIINMRFKGSTCFKSVYKMALLEYFCRDVLVGLRRITLTLQWRHLSNTTETFAIDGVVPASCIAIVATALGSEHA